MKYPTLSAILIVGLASADQPVQTISMADGRVDGLVIGAYDSTWKQCLLQDGKWVDGGSVTERASVIGTQLRHRQITQRPDGMRSVATTYYDHETLAPLHIEQEVSDASGAQLAFIQRTLSASGYTGETVRPGTDRQIVKGSLSSEMYNGAVLGLPLVSLDFARTAYEFDAFMMMFNAHYRVIATSAGTEELTHNGQTYDLQLVDVEWHHDNGDVYEPGPDGSGGRFWLLTDKCDELPYVIRYQTDTYAVEFFPNTCS